MQHSKRDKSIVDMLFLLALFGVFLISALFVVFFGAYIYQNTVNNMEDNYNARTTVSYITEKLHRADEAGSINITTENASSVIAMTQHTDFGDYITYMYLYDNSLKELTLRSDAELNKAAGVDIFSLTAFKATAEGNGMYKFEITDTDGATNIFYVTLSAAKGGIANE